MKYFYDIDPGQKYEGQAVRVQMHDGIIEQVWVDVSGGDKAFWYEATRSDELDAKIYAAIRDGSATKL